MESIDVTHSPVWREVFIVFGVSILNFSTLRNWLRLLRSKMGLHWLLGFGTKNWLVERPQRVLLHFWSHVHVMPLSGTSS